MMFWGHLHKLVPSIFGLDNIKPAIQLRDRKNNDGSIIEKVQVQSYWIAELRKFRDPGTTNCLTMAMVKTNQWKYGTLLIPSPSQSKELPIIAPEPFKTIDISHRDSNITKSLNALEIFSERELEIELDGENAIFCIEFETYYCSGVIDIANSLRDMASLRKLHTELNF